MYFRYMWEISRAIKFVNLYFETLLWRKRVLWVNIHKISRVLRSFERFLCSIFKRNHLPIHRHKGIHKTKQNLKTKTLDKTLEYETYAHTHTHKQHKTVSCFLVHHKRPTMDSLTPWCGQLLTMLHLFTYIHNIESNDLQTLS